MRYDERESGLSDWSVDSSTFEDVVADPGAIVDASGFGRFPLPGTSQGPMPIEHVVDIQMASPI